MLKCKHITNEFWAKAISIVVYLKNRSPTKILNQKTPFEALDSYKLAIIHLRIFGSKVFAHALKEDKRKLDVKTIKRIFIGYYDDKNTDKMFDPSTHKFFQAKMFCFMNMQMKKIGRKVMMHGHIPHDSDDVIK